MHMVLSFVVFALLALPALAAEKQPFHEISNHGYITGLSEGARVRDGGSLTLTGAADEVIVEAGAEAQIEGQVAVLRVSGKAVIVGEVEQLYLEDALEVVIEGTVRKMRGQGFALFKAGSNVRGRDVAVDEPHIYE